MRHLVANLNIKLNYLLFLLPPGIQQTPHAYLYHPQQIAALAAKAGAAQYMPPVIYYPYPIPVSQQTPPPAGMFSYETRDFDSAFYRN